MDDFHVAALVRSLARSRRAVVGSVLGLGAITLPGLLDARKRKHKRRKKKHKKKIARNAFGCVNVAGFCETSAQCCSGICEGPKGKKTCRAHDATTCNGQNFCLSDIATCTTTDGGDGQCAVTTGAASYCMTDAYCYDCATDADCLAICGAGAACIVCPKCGMSQLQTACAGTYDNACFLT